MSKQEQIDSIKEDLAQADASIRRVLILVAFAQASCWSGLALLWWI